MSDSNVLSTDTVLKHDIERGISGEEYVEDYS